MVLECLSKFRTWSTVMLSDPPPTPNLTPPPPFSQSAIRVKDGGRNCWQRCLKLMRWPSPPQTPWTEAREQNGRRRMRAVGLTFRSGERVGAPRTESPLCCPGWNFVLERSLRFLNPNCAQWGVSSFPFALAAEPRRGAWGLEVLWG